MGRRNRELEHRRGRLYDPWVGTRDTRVDRSGRFVVRASSDQFFGVRCGVQFEKGVGRTDDNVRASNLQQMGFSVEDTGAANAGPETAAGGAGEGGA